MNADSGVLQQSCITAIVRTEHLKKNTNTKADVRKMTHFQELFKSSSINT